MKDIIKIDLAGILNLEKDVCIYGAGTRGRELYNTILGKKNNLKITDANEEISNEFKCFIPLEKLSADMGSVVVISIRNERVVSQVLESLIERGWDNNNIFWYISERDKCEAERIDFLKAQMNRVNVKRFGNDYGGYHIAPVERIENVLSFGIGEDLSFEEELIKVYGCKVYAFDPTPKSIQFVQNSMIGKELLHFYPYGLSNEDEFVDFYLPLKETYVSGSEYACLHLSETPIKVEMKKLESIVKLCKIETLDILKMDIEGSEFKCLRDVSRLVAKPKQICFEIHDRFFDNGIQMVRELHYYLCNMGYRLIYVSDDGLTLTYVL